VSPNGAFNLSHATSKKSSNTASKKQEKLMSLNHDFYYADMINGNQVNYKKFYQEKPELSIHDDLMRYMDDTFQWFPSIHLSGNKYKRTRGFFLYGTTLINRESVPIFNHVVSSWLTLFSGAPDAFELDGGLTINADRTVGDRYKIEVQRDELIRNLTTLNEMGEKVMAGECFILHLGI
jgi:hypothetical protein